MTRTARKKTARAGKSRRHTRVNRRHFPWRFLGTVALGTILLLVHLWQKQNIKYKLDHIDRLKHQIAEMRDENKRLQAKVTQLASAGWIEKVARQNLGLGDPDHEPVVLTYSPIYEQVAGEEQTEFSAKKENTEKIAELLSK